MKELLTTTLFLFLISISLFSQRTGIWHNSHFDFPINDFSMKLKGDVKSWKMTKYNGDERTMTFDKEGNVSSDTFRGTIQTYVPPDFMVIKLKNEYEKTYPEELRKDTTAIYNDSMQLLERKSSNNLIFNLFDENGNILLHQEASSHEETRAWNSIHHKSPTYTYTVNIGALIFYRYNDQGSLTEIEYFYSDPFQNLKMVYVRDESGYLIETNRYDNYNISVSNMPDNYLMKIQENKIDTSFDINDHFPSYWNQGSPSVCKYKNNEKGQKIEYTAYGYKKGLSFKAEWEYDENDQLIREIQYNAYKNYINCILDFDKQGNVIRETYYTPEGVESKFSEMQIVYY